MSDVDVVHVLVTMVAPMAVLFVVLAALEVGVRLMWRSSDIDDGGASE